MIGDLSSPCFYLNFPGSPCLGFITIGHVFALSFTLHFLAYSSAFSFVAVILLERLISSKKFVINKRDAPLCARRVATKDDLHYVMISLVCVWGGDNAIHRQLSTLGHHCTRIRLIEAGVELDALATPPRCCTRCVGHTLGRVCREIRLCLAG